MAPPSTLLRQQLHRLCKGEGLHRDNLVGWLNQEVLSCLGIAKDDPVETVNAAISDRIRALIQRLHVAENRTIALYSFNLCGDPSHGEMKLSERLDALHAAGGPSRRKSVDRMRDTIVPELVRMMLAESEHD